MTDAAASVVGGLPPGTLLGRYQTVRRLALGGMAELYLARHRAEAGFQKLVALKRVLPHLAEDGEFVRMFLNEARLAASLVHPNIAQVTDFGSVGREYFMVMEFVHGRSVGELQRAFAKIGGVPLGCALTIGSGVAAALHYAHEARGADGAPLGLVHRDVSPSNILVSYDGAVKLVDFGIAKATATAQATRSRTIKGKLAYMSPEQAQGGAIDRRADVFSLGIVLYELTTGRRCFYAEGEFALLNKVADASFDRPTKCVPEFPRALETIIMQALHRDPDKRYATTREMQTDIEGFAVDQGISISSMELSDQLGEVFGEQQYPTTGVLPGGLTEHAPVRGPTRVLPRSGWGRAGVAILGASIGLGVGVAVMWGLGDASQGSAEPMLVAPRDVAGAQPGVAESKPPKPTPTPTPTQIAAERVGADQVDPPKVAPLGDDAVEIVAEPERPSKPSRRRTKKKRRKSQKRTKIAPPSEFLPPSHRGG